MVSIVRIDAIQLAFVMKARLWENHMSFSRPSLALIVLFAGSFALCSEDAKKDQDKLQGTWEVVEMVSNGKPIKEQGLKVIFDAEKMTLQVGDKGKREFTYKLDASKQPKAIDTTALDGAFEGKTGPGIYDLGDATLKLCLPNQETKDRPTEFKAEKGSNLVLLTLKRAKQ